MALFLVATQFVAAAAMVALAIWLLWLNPRHLANRAFGLFLVLRAGVIVAGRFADFGQGTAAEAAWVRISGFLLLPIVPTLACFVASYLLLRDKAIIAARVGVGLTAALELLYAAVPCVDSCPDLDRTWLGPFSLLTYASPFALGAVSFVLVVAAERMDSSARRESTLLLADAFALNAVLDSVVVLSRITFYGPDQVLGSFAPGIWPPIAVAIVCLAAIPAGAAIFLHFRNARSHKHIARRVIVFAILAAATAMYVAYVPAGDAVALGLLGTWRLALPVVAAYALVRHGLFDVDIRLKATVSRGLVAGAFLATFFVVAQVAQNLLSGTFGWLLGGIAAGLLLFAIHPLQAFSHRIADIVLPKTRPVRDLSSDERCILYREQVSLAWADGYLDKSERALLDHLREKLGLTPEEALQLERDGASTVR